METDAEKTSLRHDDAQQTPSTPQQGAPNIRFPSCRLILTLMSFFAFVNCYCLRVNLSVALVAMVNTTYTLQLQLQMDSDDDAKRQLDRDDVMASNTSSAVVVEEMVCHVESNETVNKVESGEFEWDSRQQGVILAAFFYGYITTQILGGVLAQRFGSKLLLLFGIAWTAVLTLLTPVVARWGDFAGIVATRVLEGVGEGVTFPAMHAMLSQWAPPLERGIMVTAVYAGAQIGTVIAMPISGLLCEYLNWPSVFYVFGALGLVWAIMWIFLVYDTPALHPRISAEERSYIETSLGTQDNKKGSMRLPLLKIAQSMPVYAIAVAHFCSNWGYYTLLTCLPQYLKYILHFDIKSNGFLAGLPYLVMWGLLLLSGVFADCMRSRNLMTTTHVRKLLTAIGFLCPALCLVATGYVNCNTPLAVSLIVIAVGLSGVGMAGWSVNHLDLAPPYAGTLMGITNTIGTIPGFVGPSVVGALTYRNQTRAAWRNVFYISAGIYVFGTIFYLIFGSGEKQAWGTLPPNSPIDAANAVKDSTQKPLRSKEDVAASV